ncbi:MAG: transposase [Acidobacteriales bacterium]|nr:transposase [Terriglobales bacterium]
MSALLARSFAPFLLALQSCFTQPTFQSFCGLVCAWVLCSGRRSLTRVIQSGQLGEFKHFCSFHRFFSHARWDLDELGHAILQLLLPFAETELLGAVDDTLARKSGRRIWGAGMHHDPLRSTQQRPFFSFGHNFVVFSLQVAFPFAPGKFWSIPILVRMYRKRCNDQRAPGKGGKLERKQTGQATAAQYRTRPELALEMIQSVARWIPGRTLRVTGDSEYAGRAISRHLPANVKLISRMVMKAALFAAVAQQANGRGRRRRKGERLPSPLLMAQNEKAKWIKTIADLYGKKVPLWYQTIDALWYPSAGQQMLRIVVVRDPRGRRRDDCFFSTDLTLPPLRILEIFSRRWPLEVCFRDVKQFLGFEDPQNRVAKATARTAPLIFLIYDLILLWYARTGYRLAATSALDRIWYTRKASVSFEDILRTLRHVTWQERIFSDSAIDAPTRKILKPFIEWAKAMA